MQAVAIMNLDEQEPVPVVVASPTDMPPSPRAELIESPLPDCSTPQAAKRRRRRAPNSPALCDSPGMGQDSLEQEIGTPEALVNSAQVDANPASPGALGRLNLGEMVGDDELTQVPASQPRSCLNKLQSQQAACEPHADAPEDRSGASLSPTLSWQVTVHDAKLPDCEDMAVSQRFRANGKSTDSYQQGMGVPNKDKPSHIKATYPRPSLFQALPNDSPMTPSKASKGDIVNSNR